MLYCSHQNTSILRNYIYQNNLSLLFILRSQTKTAGHNNTLLCSRIQTPGISHRKLSPHLEYALIISNLVKQL